MRKYFLASSDGRCTVDLRLYRKDIINAVQEELPSAVVTVEKDYYTVEPTLDRGAAIRVGKKISKTALGKYCIKIPKLFNSVEVRKEISDESESKPLGGHH